jgi:hypothetical protein
MQHTVAEDGVLLDHLHGDGSARIGIDGELDLGEAALPDGPAHLVPPHPLLPPAGGRHSPLLGQLPPPEAAPGGARGPFMPAPAASQAEPRKRRGCVRRRRQGASLYIKTTRGAAVALLSLSRGRCRCLL